MSEPLRHFTPPARSLDPIKERRTTDACVLALTGRNVTSRAISRIHHKLTMQQQPGMFDPKDDSMNCRALVSLCPLCCSVVIATMHSCLCLAGAVLSVTGK